MNRKIEINGEGYLESSLDMEFLSDVLGIPVELPTKKMNKWAYFEDKFSAFYSLETIKDIPRLVTIAFTGKNKCCYSVIKKKSA